MYIKVSIIIIIYFLCLGIIAVQFGNEDRGPIVAKKIGPHILHVPIEYLNVGIAASSPDSLTVQSFYPGNQPVFAKEEELMDAGLWWKNIDIAMKIQTVWYDRRYLNSVIRYHKTDKNLGDFHGLQHFTQSNEKDAWKLDVFIEDDEKGFFVRCDDPQYPGDEIMLCRYHFYYEDLSFRITFDRRFLPEWHVIKSNAIALYESFKSPETAADYFAQFTPILNNTGALNDTSN